MPSYNKRGEEVLDMQIDAQEERLGREVIYVVDIEISNELVKIRRILDGIWQCQSSASGLNNYEEVK